VPILLEILSILLLGTGLFLLGVETLNINIKKMAGRQFRINFQKWTSSKIKSIGSGFLLGAMTHSAGSASGIITNMMMSRLMNLEQGFTLLAAANVGTLLIVLLVNLNMKLLIMLLLGTVSIYYSVNHRARTRPTIGFLLGVALMLFGLNQLEYGAEHMIENPVIHHFFLQLHSNWGYIGVLLVGAILRLLTRSTSTVAILAIALGNAGVLDFNQMGFMIGGSPLAATAIGYFEMNEYKGSVKQLPFFQMIFELVGFIVIFLILVIPVATGISFGRIIEGGFLESLSVQVIILLLTMRLVPFFLTLMFSHSIRARLELLFPRGSVEILSTPEYIYDQALEDPETAIELIVKEQNRAASRFIMSINTVREEVDEVIDEAFDYDLETLHGATEKLNLELDRFIKEMFLKDLSRSVSEKLLSLDNSQNLIGSIEDNLYHMIKEIKESTLEGKQAELLNHLTESAHAVLSLCVEANSERDKPIAIDLIQMTSDKGKLMESIRERYTLEEAHLSQEQRKSIRLVTDHYQRIVWLLNRWMLQIKRL
jgi:phosphate:Na+ symporter